MGSIAIEAVNHFFAPRPTAEHQRQHQHHDTLPPHQQPARARTQSNTSMSVAGSRATSSHVGNIGTQSTSTYSRHASTPQQPHSLQVEQQPPAASLPHSDAQDSVSAPASSASASSLAPSASSQDTSSEPPLYIKIKDLAHIQRIADEDSEAFSDNGQAFRRKQGDQGPRYEISDMPIEHVIEMVAGLLTKITAANDMQHDHLHRQMPTSDGGVMSSQTNSVLAFHGKNVPSITILSYLNRINKYCPTSYEVFISLLVYFDRMTEKVNSGPIQNLRDLNQQATDRASEDIRRPSSTQDMEGVTPTGSNPAQQATPPMSSEFEKQVHSNVPGTPHSRPHHPESPSGSSFEPDNFNLSHFFVVDSFNIHRLVIAGVTCASKFFSDIFYTNSRYAKVGGLPLPELNHLELQFLLLNDFRLSVPVEEMEAYGTMLVEFYAREVLIQRQQKEPDGSEQRSAPGVPTG